jgi:hypothetical protein
MIHDIEWDKETASEPRESVKEEIINAINSGHIPMTPCHAGTLRVRAEITGPLATQLVGNIRCSCGTTLAKFEGTEDGSKIEFTKV